jgi:hypothetical protein
MTKARNTATSRKHVEDESSTAHRNINNIVAHPKFFRFGNSEIEMSCVGRKRTTIPEKTYS